MGVTALMPPMFRGPCHPEFHSSRRAFHASSHTRDQAGKQQQESKGPESQKLLDEGYGEETPRRRQFRSGVSYWTALAFCGQGLGFG